MPDLSVIDSEAVSSGQVLESEMQSCGERATCSPEKTSPMEEELVCEGHGPVSSGDDTEQELPVEAVAFSPDHVVEERPLQANEVGVRRMRDAAIRARENYLEWTRHLLALQK